MVVNFIIAQIVSAFTPAPPAEVQEIVENIRVPRELRRPDQA
jgi:cation/acetate symporter